MVTLLDLCVSSLRRGHANLLCIVPILTDDPRRESIWQQFAAQHGEARHVSSCYPCYPCGNVSDTIGRALLAQERNHQIFCVIELTSKIQDKYQWIVAQRTTLSTYNP